MQARGNYPPPPGVTDILGLEISGVIAGVGAYVPKDIKVGDRVASLLAGGGYATRVAVHHKMLFHLPDDWSFEMGAALPEAWLTAYVNLFIEGGLRSSAPKGDAPETVLIHAGGSGVGTAAVQLAREVGAKPIVTAGAESKLEICRELGAVLAINYKEQDFAETIIVATKNRGVDLILDPVGGSYLQKNINVLARRGRMVQIGLLGGAQASNINIAPILMKNLTIKGSTLRNRSILTV